MPALPPPLSALTSRLGIAADGLDGLDTARASAALDDATALALAEVTPAAGDAWLTKCPPVVTLVILKAARREFENPRGFVTETQGERSATLAVSSGVYLTAREIATIRRAATGYPGGFVGSVRTPSSYSE
ncbi:hypothetical protein A0130_03185 [Leifsonia xyli]|uniref:hypothetical protein n=1 Tax=Leifsonia xyli TaxID=1575 RepID=UPI0007CDEBFF|nr:hypothetical protein A0130_03185 [Leifsonia xyli]